MKLAAFAGSCIVTATGVAFVASISMIPWLYDKLHTLDNRSWEFQIIWAILTLFLLSLVHVVFIGYLVAGWYLKTQWGWWLATGVSLNFMIFSVQARSPDEMKVLFICIGLLLVTASWVGRVSASRHHEQGAKI